MVTDQAFPTLPLLELLTWALPPLQDRCYPGLTALSEKALCHQEAKAHAGQVTVTTVSLRAQGGLTPVEAASAKPAVMRRQWKHTQTQPTLSNSGKSK